MTTKAEMIEIIKAENPTLQSGDDKQGYTPIVGAEYEAQILEWANARLTKEAKLAEAEAAEIEAQAAKTAAQAKLTALGLTTDDLKALGLGGNE